MDNQEIECYEVEIKRFFTVFAPQNLVMLVILCTASIVTCCLNDTLHTFDAILLCAGCALILTAKLLSAPRCLMVTPETIKFRYATALLTLLTTGRLRFGEDIRHDKAYTLYHIQSIEYMQSPLEKVFSCGHIRICGDVNAGEKGKEQRSFTIYGITDFQEVSVWMKGFVRLSNRTEST